MILPSLDRPQGSLATILFFENTTLKIILRRQRTDEDGFTIPLKEEWFVERYRDWGLLGAEVMALYDDFFKNQ